MVVHITSREMALTCMMQVQKLLETRDPLTAAPYIQAAIDYLSQEKPTTKATAPVTFEPDLDSAVDATGHAIDRHAIVAAAWREIERQRAAAGEVSVPQELIDAATWAVDSNEWVTDGGSYMVEAEPFERLQRAVAILNRRAG